MSRRANLSLVPARAPGVIVGTGVPPELREAVELGGTILLLGRNSSSGGAASRRAAVGNCLDAAALLARQGIELRHLLPSAADLEERLCGDAASVEYTDTKGRLRHLRSAEVHPAPGVVLVVQQGSGVARRKGSSSQPAAERVEKAVRDWAPVLLAAMEVRSAARSGYAWDPIVAAIQEQLDGGGILFYTDSRLPCAAFNHQVRRHIIDEGELAWDEADKIRQRMLRGARRNTDRTSHGGRFRYGFGGILPPPFDTVRLKNSRGALGEVWAVLDCPECRFPEAEVAMGQGQPPAASGRQARADQVALVRWFYRHYLLPEWSTTDVARYLISHGFSSPGARRLHQDADGHQQLREESLTADAAAICSLIESHMDFHATGDLWLPLNEDGTLVAVHVEHPDGLPLCSEIDRARIEAANSKMRHDAAPARLFSGHPVTIDGETAWLIGVRDDGSGELNYAFAKSNGTKHGGWVLHCAPYLPHRRLFRAIAESANRPELFRSMPTSNRAAIVAADERLAYCTAERARWERDVTGVKKALADENRTGKAKEATSDQYNESVANLAQAERELAVAQRARDRLNVGTGLPVNEWFPFLRSLHDPRDTTYRDRMRRELGPLTVTTRNAPTPRHPGRVELEFEAELTLLDQDGRPLPISVRGTSERVAHGSAADTVRGTVALLRAGTPMVDIACSDKRHLGRLVRSSLGHPPGSLCRIHTIRDPRLTAPSMAVCHPEPVGPRSLREQHDSKKLDAADLRLGGPPLSPQSIWRLADTLGVPRTLLRHLVALHEDPPVDNTWFRLAAPSAQRLLAAAARRPVGRPETWLWRRIGAFLEPWEGGYGTVPCSHCGSRDRLLPRIDEMIGLVCSECRRDDTGNVWPENPYNTYLNDRGP